MSKARTYCAAANCRNNNKSSEHWFFNLPTGRSEKEIERCRKWLELLGREDLLEKPNLKKNSYRVCSAHFDESAMIVTTQRTLRGDAIPTLRLANQPDEKPSYSAPAPSLVEEKPTQTFGNIEEETRTEESVKKRKLPDDISVLASMLTKEEPNKRQLSEELKKCKAREKKLNNELKKLRLELEAKNESIACNDPTDEITKRFQKLIDWRNKLINKYRSPKHYAEYKLFVLDLHYSNPHVYGCLQTVLKLPTISALNKFKRLIPPTLDKRVLDSLALKIKSLPDTAKYCTISLHEVTLKRNLYYNITNDEVIGLHNVSGRTSSEMASYAFVIMLKGIYFKWQQPIAYALFGTAKQNEDIDKWLSEVISKLSTVGIKIKAIVSDQGSEFDKFAKYVKKVTMKKPYFVYDTSIIYYIYDVPQLITSLRNDFLTSDFILDGNKISWEYITQLYNDQKNRDLRLIPNITDAHMHPNAFQKMKAKLAVQVLSRTMGAALHTYIDLGQFSEEARQTADFIESINNLFDVLNSNRMKCDDNLQTARLSLDQEIILNDAKTMFAALKAIDRKTGENVTKSIETFANFQIAIESITMLFGDLLKDGFEYLLTRRLSKDNLDIHFGGVRQQDGSRSEPTPIQLQRAFSKLVIRNMTKNTPNTNCEMDLSVIILKAEEMIKTDLTKDLPPQTECRRPVSLAGETDYRIDLPTKNALTYVAGYLFFKCANNHNCPTLNTISRSALTLNNPNLFPKYRAYNKLAKFYRRLKMPPREFIEYIQNLESVFTQKFEKVIHSNPGNRLFELLQTVPPQTPCTCFPVEYLIRLFTRFRIYTALKLNNRQFKDDKKSIRKYLKLTHL